MPITESSSFSLSKELTENITALLVVADPKERIVHFIQQWPLFKFGLPSSHISFKDFLLFFHIDSPEVKEIFISGSGDVFFPGSFILSATKEEGINSRYSCKINKAGEAWMITGTETHENKPVPVIQSTIADDFAYIASHDMQEPVRKLSTYVERLIEKLPEEQREAVAPYTDRIIKSAGHLRSMIDGLLEFSRVGREGDFRMIELDSIVEAAVNENKNLVSETRAEITISKLPAIIGNQTELRQLFFHLINNALKFNDGKPVIEIFERPVTETEQKELNTNVPLSCISIKDNGIGFKQEYAEKIFEIFRRIHPKIKYTGNGLGLAICRKIIQHHRGIIKAYGQEENGSEFHIILPVK
ncbi:MAG: domain S-box protein [Chitinophagaceae bacterium]|nr:domain S-box protein [Chitinophagaceae bacterium]